jgi:hypothetical protein
MSRFALLLLFAVTTLSAQQAAPRTPVKLETPRVFSFSAQNLLALRTRLDRGDASLQPALAALRAAADRELTAKPPSVMNKRLTAASGDPHDYFSFGPYWWPDPVKPGGLPYLRRDGEINPETRKGMDDHFFGSTISAIETLALAYWFTGDERYAVKAGQFTRTWFLDAATRMNPNLEHAQAIPGVNNGRGIGIIEANRLGVVADSLALLDGSSAWTTEDRAAFTAWLGEYYHWLTTSPNGLDEKNQENNHGTWYDAQAAHLALVLGHPDDAKKFLTAGLAQRLTREIEPDGSQPRELARTKSFNYSLFNLEALFTCAQLAESAGVDWWNFTTADGRSLGAALAYLAPYADPAKPWIKKDLEEGGRGRLLPLFARYLAHRDDARFRTLYGKFSPTTDQTARWRLLWPAP